MELTVTPYPHQQQAIKYILKHFYVLLADEMGLGKTLSSIAVSAVTEGKTLVVCPAFLKHNWKQEYAKFTTADKVLVIDKKSDYKKIDKHDVIIVNYERIKDLPQEDYSLIVADECHFLKNMSAKRTELFHELVDYVQPERLILLTGTPVKNRIPDFYSLLRLLSMCPHGTNGKDIKDKFRSEYKFSKHFCNENVFTFPRNGRRVEVRKFEGARNIPELKSYFQGKYMRRLTSQVIDLPEMITKEVWVDYKHDDSELAEAFEAHKGKLDGHIMRLKTQSATAKAPFTAEYALNIFRETGNPVVVFSDHREPVRVICSHLQKSKVKFGVITGDTKVEDRQKIVNAFQDGKIDFVVATIGAASTGITLTRSRDLVFNDLNYTPAENEQASKRIHRIGQKNSCIIHIMTGSSVDFSINKNLLSIKQDIEKVVTHG
jgi:SNF2 family DNA or RNA helicase